MKTRVFLHSPEKASNRFYRRQACAWITKDATRPDTATAASETPKPSRLTVTDKWVLFARPRSQHVVLQDIDRLRRSTEDEEHSIEGLPKRLVTEPSQEAPDGAWEPLSTRIGGSDGGSEAAAADR